MYPHSRDMDDKCFGVGNNLVVLLQYTFSALYTMPCTAIFLSGSVCVVRLLIMMAEGTTYNPILFIYNN